MQAREEKKIEAARSSSAHHRVLLWPVFLPIQSTRLAVSPCSTGEAAEYVDELNWAALSHKHCQPNPTGSRMASAQTMATQRVPAWKRLGLKLKSAEPQADTLSSPTAAQRSDATLQKESFDSPKRKREHFGDSSAAKPSLKKSKTDDRQFGTPLRTQKSVSFAEGSDATNKITPEPKKKAKSTPKKKGPKTPKPEAPAPAPDLTLPLEYLRLWKTSRASWKFNKNLQTHLISHAFDSTLVPAADIDTFYEYIRDLKGYSRIRLLETAKNVCTEDMDDERDQFPAGTADVESKKKQYEEIMSNALRPNQTEPKRKRFHEADFATSRDVDPEVARRVAKRMRAEIVTEELNSESDGSETTGGSNVATASEKEASGNEAVGEPDAGKRLKLNDGTTRAVKRVRASKRRGADVDDSSSESDDPDSDSDSSSDDGSDSSDDSSTDSSESSDDEMDVDSRPNDQETSSSSSSSSDEDDDSDEDSDSNED